MKKSKVFTKDSKGRYNAKETLSLNAEDFSDLCTIPKKAKKIQFVFTVNETANSFLSDVFGFYPDDFINYTMPTEMYCHILWW